MESLTLVKLLKAHMANRVGSEHQSPSRPPISLLVGVLLLGTLLAWWGTRDHRHLFGESLREPVAAAGVVLPQATQEESASLNRGFQISQMQCAGCHETFTRSSAPSYQEIVTFYRREFPASTDGSDFRSRLASAATHPRPGWGNFAPGPSESQLSLDDRIAVAAWILSNFQQVKNASVGAGK
jgi:cytochrome c551/c552